ncbi:MAG TPA: decaprenyl-phosphate phosphoribosyltransferase [Thermodesulfovibrionales bacterium]|nr:decaprenyl-phosphate phosphoribosyltransferase [Thermodesulfovibrionales bacterium]
MGTLADYIRELRVKHWVKNLFLFAAPFFGGVLFKDPTLRLALPAFLSFSFCASAVYVLNDIVDIRTDRLHPKKSLRPIASGAISKGNAVLVAVMLTLISSVMSFFISPLFFGLLVLYLSIQLAYSTYLKRVAVADIFCIASGFVIRVIAGGAAFHVYVSRWLLVTMFMISLVLAAGKRLGEVRLLHEKVEAHRKSLDAHFVSTLNEILVISASGSLISYALYTIEQFRNLVYTVPVVTFGLFRYLLISKKGGGDPTEALTGDRWLALTVIVWLLMIGVLRYN